MMSHKFALTTSWIALGQFLLRMLPLAAPFCMLPASAVVAQPASLPIGDIAGRADAAAIEAVVGRGLLTPQQPGAFNPTGLITRADFAAAAQKLFSLPPPANPVWFADVSPTASNYAAIEAVGPYVMQARGMLCPTCLLSSSFGPDNPLPRVQAIALLTQILVSTGREQLATPADSDTALRDVPDGRTLPPTARRLVATALASGVATLQSNQTLDAGALLDRGGAAVLLNNATARVPLPRP
jgi:2',3'-cyclic-nucleotide 2'-phosphodiesterase/3'-nucleotidase/5'-nucleotidase